MNRPGADRYAHRAGESDNSAVPGRNVVVERGLFRTVRQTGTVSVLRTDRHPGFSGVCKASQGIRVGHSLGFSHTPCGPLAGVVADSSRDPLQGAGPYAPRRSAERVKLAPETAQETTQGPDPISRIRPLTWSYGCRGGGI
jgi:hypothetical protein